MMARSIKDLCDDIIYEAGMPNPRPVRIKSLARELKRKYGNLEVALTVTANQLTLAHSQITDLHQRKEPWHVPD